MSAGSSGQANPSYVDPVLNDILSQINFLVTPGVGFQTTTPEAGYTPSGNDLTLLSALPYLPIPTSSVDPFSQANQSGAVNAVLSNFTLGTNETSLYAITGYSSAIGNTTATTSIAPAVSGVLLNGNLGNQFSPIGSPPFVDYNPSPLFASYMPLMTGTNGGTVNMVALTVSNLIEGYYQAGSTTFLQLLCGYLNANQSTTYGITTATVSPVSAVNPNLVGTQYPTFQDVIDLTRYLISLVLNYPVDSTSFGKISTRLKQLNTNAAAFASWARTQTYQYNANEQIEFSALAAIADNCLQQVLQILQLVNYSLIDNTEFKKALITFGLGPWMVMSFVASFQNANNTFITQAYARVAVFYLTMVTLTNLAAVDDNDKTKLQSIVNAIAIMINNSVDNIDNTGPISDVLALSLQNNSTAKELAQESQSLNNRVGIASDLQTTYQYEQKVSKSLRITFYSWLVAFIVVLVTSVLLIVTDRVSIFLPFAYMTLILILAAAIIPWAIGMSRGTDQ